MWRPLTNLAFLLILIVTILSVVSTGVENPTINYCFSRIKYTTEKPIDCSFFPLSNSPFIFGKLEQSVLNITSHALENKKALILMCKAPYPVRWLAQKPLGSVTHLSNNDTNRLDQNPLTKEPQVFYQGILVLLGDEFSRKLRCESLSNSSHAADAFLNLNEDTSPAWNISDHLTANFVVGENEDRFTVPCVADEFHGNFDFHFIKRSRMDRKLNAEPSDECVNCTCFAKVSGNLTTDIDAGVPEILSDQCIVGASTNSAKAFIRGISAASDCNIDGMISCREYSWAYISGGTPCRPGITVDSSPYKGFLLRLQNCLKQPIKDFDIGPHNYDPRIGFRLTERPDFEAAYECFSDDEEKDVKYALSAKFQSPASLLYINGQIFCNAESNQYKLNLMIGNCSSVTECDFKFELLSPLILSSNYPYPENEFKSFEINEDNPNWITADHIHSYVQCHGSYSKTENDRISFVRASDYLFTGLDNQKYFALQGFPIGSVIDVSTEHILPMSSYGYYNFTCKISTFVLLPNIQFVVEYGRDKPRRLIVKEDEHSRSVVITSEINPNEATLVYQLELKLSEDMSKILCFAPWRNSTDWALSELKLNLLEDNLGGNGISNKASFVYTGLIVVAFCLGISIWAAILWKRNKRLKTTIRNLTEEEVDEFNNGVKKQKGIKENDVPIESRAFNHELRIPGQSLIVEDIILGEVQRKCAAVTEFSPLGCLNSYLRSSSFMDGDTAERALASERLYENASEGALNKSTLISFSKQIANGMAYLAKKSVMHGDLATRNVLVFPNNVVKITDFGLSRKLYNCASYVKTQQTPLPWRWMAIESLRFFEFSEKSDVWSFGVTVWEIFSLAQVPFAGVTWTPDFSNELESGLRLSKPLLASQAIYDLMLKCWKIEPRGRPDFYELHALFRACEQEQTVDIVSEHYCSINI
ncbi:unnamed protein product [Allacma fusca]|uniref:Protein kinase domain-containing protein n=1 Tax=Allacma fusca TaxID=39272 RepID=A0A8J2K9D8_9HEXA|nr:unnamed protein product [Allacma fusca]